MAATLEQQQRNMSKSITRLLQHSILQLCNEHIGYTHKLQILGVLCMTVDDEQQELVVKVNNTLKRVNPSTPKDSSPSPLVPFTPDSHQVVPQTHDTVPVSIPVAVETPSETPRLNGSSPTNGGGRKSHGRKGTNPVKVHNVYEEGEPQSDDDETEGHITVIPEAPEASMSYCSMPLSSSPGPVHSPTNQNPRQRMLAPSDVVKTSGSAKRKAGHQFRVPHYSSPGGSPFGTYQSADSPYSVEEGDNGGAEGPSGGGGGGSGQLGGGSSNGVGLRIPIYVAGTFSQEGAEGEDSGLSDHAGERQVNGERSSPVAENGLSLKLMHLSELVKKEQEDFYEYNNQAMDLSTDDLSRSQCVTSDMAAAFPIVSCNSLPSQVPYSTLSMLAAARQGAEALIREGDGLSIKYTSTGPYTVGANGKDVSNSSRIKDIIMYDDQSPLSTQKGARIETDFIVDKLGLDGRKRRRRAPEDQLTPEEIAEYLGHDRETYSFKCKYCQEEFESVTKYIHHSVASHQAYICHQCGKSFTTKSSLLRHRPIHTGMRRFACSICKKTFYRKDKCKAHIKRHLGVEQQGGHVAQVESAQIEVATE